LTAKSPEGDDERLCSTVLDRPWYHSCNGVFLPVRDEATTLDNLPAGPQTVTLTATDGDGKAGTTTVDIPMGYRLFLPPAVKQHEREHGE
jgi:hypothetical protein